MFGVPLLNGFRLAVFLPNDDGTFLQQIPQLPLRSLSTCLETGAELSEQQGRSKEHC